jgi:23S rRNA (cytosine1962-C5)-methyltransferase
MPGRWVSPAFLQKMAMEQTNAHRLFSSGLAWIERFGGDWLLSYQEEMALDRVREEIPAFQQATGVLPSRLFGRFVPVQNVERFAPVLLEGDAGAGLETVVEEGGVRYGMDFGAGYSAGLFLDQRANRAFLRRMSPKKVLNTFAYTCSFSVVAALAGAQTTSVDLSRKSLDRGRSNFTLNGLNPVPDAGHRFYAEDTFDLLPRLARKGERFDAVILDPPTFSRGNKGRKFQVEQHLGDLLALALEVATPGAKILLSTNCSRMTRKNMELLARGVLRSRRQSADFRSESELEDIPAELAAKTLWICLKS